MTDWHTLLTSTLTHDPTTVRLLRAFGGLSGVVTATTRSDLVSRCLDLRPLLADRIRRELDVDPGQAAMFTRRWSEVLLLLDGLGPRGEALAIGLVARTAEIMNAPSALRVRAIADFYYSQAARLQHEGHARSFDELLAAGDWTDAGEGLRHRHLQGMGPFGPLNVNLLEVRDRRFRTVDTRPHTDLVALCAQHGAVAATSGGFFLYSEPDIEAPSHRTDPVGLLVTDGHIVNLPVFRRGALVQLDDGRTQLRRIGLQDVRVNGQPIVVNHAGAVSAWTRAHTQQAPQPGLQVVGTEVVGEGIDVPLAGFVLCGIRGPLHFALTEPIVAAMAGGPFLLGPDAMNLLAEDFAGTAPPITFSQDETFDENLLPRMAVGQRPDGSLVFAAVDGRDPHHATGLTLRATASLLAHVGCERALNLDGGSSKRMVLHGAQLDRASTEVVSASTPTRVRPVHTAILIGAGRGTNP